MGELWDMATFISMVLSQKCLGPRMGARNAIIWEGSTHGMVGDFRVIFSEKGVLQ